MKINSIQNILDKKICCTWYENKYSSSSNDKSSNVGHIYDSWSSLVKFFLDREIYSYFNASNVIQYEEVKEKFSGFIFAEMIENRPRSGDNVIKHYGIVLDIDGGTSIEKVKNDLKEYEYLIYSTGSQGLKNEDRFKVILPLLNPVNKDDYNSYSESLKNRFYYSDSSFCKSVQMQYLPSINEKYKNEFIAEHHKGLFFDILKLEKNQIIYNEFSKDIFKVIDNHVFYEVENKDDISSLILKNKQKYLGYNEKLKLSSCLKSCGFQRDEIINIIDSVKNPDAKNSGSDMYDKANSSYGTILGLRNFLPENAKILLKPSNYVYKDEAKYDFEMQLNEGQYLSDVIGDIHFKQGLNLLIASTGVGKNYAMNNRENTKIVTPLLSIVHQSGSNNNIHKDNITTWNQLKEIMRTPENCKQWDLVIDEAHGIIFDYDYKYEIIETLNNAMRIFNKVILMSGTIKPDYFSNVKFKTINKVTKLDKNSKQIQPYFCKSKIDSIIRDLKNSTRKSILLINDKVKGKFIGEQSGKKFLLINADVKDTEEVQALFSTGSMIDYDCIIGTNSIVEGLSIVDDLDEVDIFICEDTEPDRIEQFSNRFRNIKALKHVNYYSDMKEIIGNIDGNIEKVISSAEDYAKSLQLLFNNAQTNKQKESIIEQYCKFNPYNISFKNNSFSVNYNMIDYQSYIHRKEKSSQDFNYFASRLLEYNFQILLPIYDDYSSNANININIKEIKKIEKEFNLDKENSELIQLKDYFKTGIEPEIKGGTFTYYKRQIEMMISDGLKINDVPDVIDSIIVDRGYKDKIRKDIENNKTECKYRKLVISEVKKSLFLSNKKTVSEYISTDDISAIATKVARLVLVDEFNSNIDLMLNSPDWRSLISKKMPDGNNVSLNTSVDPLDTFFIKNKMASRVIKKYISIDTATKVTKSKCRITAYKILYFSLTGLTFN